MNIELEYVLGFSVTWGSLLVSFVTQQKLLCQRITFFIVGTFSRLHRGCIACDFSCAYFRHNKVCLMIPDQNGLVEPFTTIIWKLLIKIYSCKIHILKFALESFYKCMK